MGNINKFNLLTSVSQNLQHFIRVSTSPNRYVWGTFGLFYANLRCSIANCWSIHVRIEIAICNSDICMEKNNNDGYVMRNTWVWHLSQKKFLLLRQPFKKILIVHTQTLPFHAYIFNTRIHVYQQHFKIVWIREQQIPIQLMNPSVITTLITINSYFVLN